MGTRITHQCILPSAQGDSVGVLDEESFAAHNRACMHRYQRFAPYLALRTWHDTHDSRPM
jgi:hypothetical protein